MEIRPADCPGEGRVGEAIYLKLYWERPGFDNVAIRYPRVAAELFDTGINMDTATAGAFLQRPLNALVGVTLVLNGAIGPKSLDALVQFRRLHGAAGEAALLKALDALQGERYISIAEARPSQRAFVFGWLAHLGASVMNALIRFWYLLVIAALLAFGAWEKVRADKATAIDDRAVEAVTVAYGWADGRTIASDQVPLAIQRSGRALADMRRARAEAAALDAENINRVRDAQDAITKEIVDDYEDRIADARRRADALRLQLDTQARADLGSGGNAPMPGIPDAAARTDEAAGEGGLSVAERLIATETALRLIALQDWVNRRAPLPSRCPEYALISA